MTDAMEILRARLVAALRSVETSAPRLQVPYGAMADAVLALGDLECRWEVRGGVEDDEADDRWFTFADSRAEAVRIARHDEAASVFALYSLKFTPISADPEETP